MIERVEKRLRLESEIRQRLKNVCRDLTAEDFQGLIESIADNAMKSDLRASQFRLRPIPR